jgi:hypothetical protein
VLIFKGILSENHAARHVRKSASPQTATNPTFPDSFYDFAGHPHQLVSLAIGAV